MTINPGEEFRVKATPSPELARKLVYLAGQDIEQELQELRQQREKMLEQAYRDEQGRRIFMLEDESAAYYEDGSQVAADEFAQIKDRLRGRPTWGKLQMYNEREEELSAERDQIHRHDTARDKLREDLAEGGISKEEAERREQEIEQSMPERVRHSYGAPASQSPVTDSKPVVEPSAEEAAALNVRAAPLLPR